MGTADTFEFMTDKTEDKPATVDNEVENAANQNEDTDALVLNAPTAEQAEDSSKAVDSAAVTPKPEPDSASKSPKQKRGFPWLGVFNLLLILGLIAAAGYYWQLQQKTEAEKQAAFDALKQQIASKADAGKIPNLRPLETGLGEITSRIEQLQAHQKDLQASSEKLYELFGRDENGWQLAEVEYLMRIAQHKLILENDFEGAAITLQAASDRIATTGDMGLLPVRVKISDEIAELKTRRRADLVGMTLKLSQLGQQIRGLIPGFQPRTEASSETEAQATSAEEASIEEQVKTFFNSLISVKRETDVPPTQTEALIINVGDTLEDNLKLTRWSVLERDAFQFNRLMKVNIELFEGYYNLDDAANNDFYTQLKELQKAEIKPEKPDINGSLEMLKKIISKRDDKVEEISSEDANNG
jgi:uroporphyrin-3 C-methyltransferase